MRASGSTATYDAWLGSGDLTITAVGPTVVSLTADSQTPIAPGTTVTWNAVAAGGTTPLQYEFWLYRPTGGWLISVFRVAQIDEAVVRRALVLGWPDFEDAVCAAAAEALGCEAIVTRDPDGFPDSPVPVIDPAGALTWILGA